MVCVFSYWSETYPRRQVTASCFFCGSSFFFFFENDISTWETPFNFHGDWGSHFTGLLRQVCVVLLVLQHFHCTNNPQSSGLAERTNGIKTLMETFVEVLQIPWSKALPFSLLNLRSTIFWELIKFHPLR